MEIEENSIYLKYAYLARYSGFPESIVVIFNRLLCKRYHEMVLYHKHKEDLIKLDSLNKVVLNKFYEINNSGKKYESDYLGKLNDIENKLYKIFKMKWFLNSPRTYPGIKPALVTIQKNTKLQIKFDFLFRMFLYEIESQVKLNDLDVSDNLFNLIDDSNIIIKLDVDTDLDLYKAFSYDIVIPKFERKAITECLYLMQHNKVLNYNLFSISSEQYAIFERAKFYIKAYLIPEDFEIDENTSRRFLGNFKDDANLNQVAYFFGQCSTSEKWSLLHTQEKLNSLYNLFKKLT